MNKRKCLECGVSIYGRPDKKFCCDGCRNAHHNKVHAESGRVIRKISRILKKNRRILAQLNPKGKCEVYRDQLLRADFDFRYFTSYCEVSEDVTYYFCYDQGYRKMDNDWYSIVTVPENVLVE